MQLDKSIQRILNPDQFRRWKQIALQAEAPMSIMRPDVAERLQFSEEQMQQFHEIFMNMRPPQPPRPGEQPPSPEDMERMHKQMMAHREELLRKVLGIFTADQRSKWNDMTGKPFKLNHQPPQRRGE
jgi:hypothetical protein